MQPLWGTGLWACTRIAWQRGGRSTPDYGEGRLCPWRFFQEEQGGGSCKQAEATDPEK